jgi:hypothetical protein
LEFLKVEELELITGKKLSLNSKHLKIHENRKTLNWGQKVDCNSPRGGVKGSS